MDDDRAQVLINGLDATDTYSHISGVCISESACERTLEHRRIRDERTRGL